jgi:hypothetical protein
LARESLVDAVRAVCGVQGQLSPAMMLALRARVSDLTLPDVEKAISENRSLVRTWAMRGTLHLSSADIRWLVALLGPLFAAKGKDGGCSWVSTTGSHPEVWMLSALFWKALNL